MTDRLSLDQPISLSGEELHPHAARQLRAVLGNRVMPAGQSAGDALPIRLQLDPSRPEGAFQLSIAGDGITVTGGPFSGVIYGANELASLIDQSEQSVALAEIDDVPGLPYRTFWNWDHSTNWNMSQIGVQEIGVMNPYAKPPEGFLADFKRTVDYMSKHRIAAITIFGFLRTSHGGIAAAQE
ncbi:MAG TPA: glycoside hydrolase family 20 zincin-like fold domain-containing protein, partial [Thermomicrobiales bacterium]|nr:glycoside hydrolase family 20 zincin-like fold domain-containing protein [Thermomicrobiales bacterium]